MAAVNERVGALAGDQLMREVADVLTHSLRRSDELFRYGDDEFAAVLEDVRKHTKASSSCGSCTGLVEQLLASTIGGTMTGFSTSTGRRRAGLGRSRRNRR